ILPVKDNACNIPIEAAELCIIAVTTVPTKSPNNGFVNNVSICEKCGSFANGDIADDINCIPHIKTENPTKNVPKFLLLDMLFLAVIIIMTPIKANIGQNDSGFNNLKKKFSLLIPDKLKIHAVIVVPTFDPIITPIT